MRIIAGNLRGSSLHITKNKNTRPLKNLARESIFNLLTHSNKILLKLEEANILDLYAGTGSFGLECLSRQSKCVYFVENEKLALQALVKTLEKCTDEMSPEDIQTLIYSTGKENGYTENLRDWFKLIYEVVFGDENGPRMGFFISFFGVNETKELLINKLK